MDLFTILIGNILPLYVIILFGFLGGRFLNITSKDIATFVIYFVAPVVVFDAGANVIMDWSVLTLPAFNFILSFIMILSAYKIGKLFLEGSEPNLFACACFWKNSGYFGIPLALFIFPENIANLYIIMIMGSFLVEVTIGVYLLARHELTPMDSVKKFLGIPGIYALAFGLLINSLGFEMPEMFDGFFTSFKGAVVVMGMAIIGINIGQIKRFSVDLKLTSSILGVHFFIWPALVWSCIQLDAMTTQFIHSDYYAAMMLLSVLPVGANLAVYASEMNVAPQKASTVVLISTMTGIFTVPLVIKFFF